MRPRVPEATCPVIDKNSEGKVELQIAVDWKLYGFSERVPYHEDRLDTVTGIPMFSHSVQLEPHSVHVGKIREKKSDSPKRFN